MAADSKVVLGATEGKEYIIGSMRVQTDPVPDADVLYLGKDGLVHIDEVKNTARALRQKLKESPEQIDRLQRWYRAQPANRAIRVVIETDADWTDIFARGKGESQAVLERLFNQEVPLSIGSYNLSVEQMRQLWQAVERKSTQMQNEGTFKGWKDFYNQMRTLTDAENFLGVSLK